MPTFVSVGRREKQPGARRYIALLRPMVAFRNVNASA
jgi:hypothetical protein